MGQVILMTGEKGKGKSTLVSQFGTMAIKAFSKTLCIPVCRHTDV